MGAAAGLAAGLGGGAALNRNNLDAQRMGMAAQASEREIVLKDLGDIGSEIEAMAKVDMGKAMQMHQQLKANPNGYHTFALRAQKAGLPNITPATISSRIERMMLGVATPQQAGKNKAVENVAQATTTAQELTTAGVPTTQEEAAQAQGLVPKPEAPQTEAAKVIFDQAKVDRQFGKGSVASKAYAEAIAGGSEVKLTDIAGLRKEYTTQSAPFIDVRDAYTRIANTPDSGMGDVALVTNFMKLLDPGSVVREGEFAQAASAAGLGDRVIGLLDRVDKGTRLTVKQRADLKNVADQMFDGQLKTQLKTEEVFKGLAAKLKMQPDQVVVDYIGDLRTRPAKKTPTTTKEEAVSAAAPKVDPASWDDTKQSQLDELLNNLGVPK